MEIKGLSLIGNEDGTPTGDVYCAVNPATDEALPETFHACSAEEVDSAATLAATAFCEYRRMNGKQRATFLRAAADEIGDILADLRIRVPLETGLPPPRVTAETARTTNQLRLFAELIEEGSWVDARVDHGDPDRQPLPRPDVRSMLRPAGPVAVFGASNFPLAFSVAGGDTASALAAGCPVIAMAHSGHPGAAELVGRAVRRATRATDMPDGVFSLLLGRGREAGAALVRHPAMKGVGFTGSRAGGRALFDMAAARPEPIPVYAEMSSINPVFIFPGALEERAETIADGLCKSLNLGVGQFCTNPGLVILLKDEQSEAFARRFAGVVGRTAPATMLRASIHGAYLDGVARKRERDDVRELTEKPAESGPGACSAVPAVFVTDGRSLLADETLSEEVFGPSTLLVMADGMDELLQVVAGLEGQLTATVHATGSEMAGLGDLLAALETKVGRVIHNQFPTGVEVCHAMVHGGPYPATSDGRHTSVGTAAIERWTRRVCYQNMPDASLPDEVKESNPLGIVRLVDGKRSL